MTYDYNDASQVSNTHYSAIYNAGNLGLPARDVATDYTTGGLWAQDTTDGGDTVIAKADYNWHNQPVGLDSRTPAMGLKRNYSWQDATGYLDTLAGTTGEAADPTTWLSLDYAYDAGGNIRNIDGRAHKPAVTATDGTITSPAATLAGAWCYTYDGLNRLTTAKTGQLPDDAEPSSTSTCATNDGDNTVVGSKHHLAYSYTRDGLATYSDQASGATASYAYPTTGNPEGKQPVHGVTTITQSGNDDKKVMPLSGAGTIALAYDTAGRITSSTKTDANQPTGSPGTWYGYDTLGNLAQQTTGAQADAGDREVTDALYDADGMRVLRRTTTHKNNKAAITSTFYLGDTEITLTGAKNTPRTLLRTYTTSGGTPVATEENKATGAGVGWTWLLADQQHNIRLTRDSAGIKRTNYLPNGAPTGNVNLAPGGRGYLNKTHDPSGDIRLDHRNYTPGINILTTPDPLLAPYDPQTLNPYAYARNNPITNSDPTGLICKNAGDADCHRTGQTGTESQNLPGSYVPPVPPALPDYPDELQPALDQHLADGGDTESFGSWYLTTHLPGGDADAEQQREGVIAAHCARYSADHACDPASAAEFAMASTWVVGGGSLKLAGMGLVKGIGAIRAAWAARAAKPAIGFAEGLGQTALTPGRLQHGTKHLIKAGVLPGWSGKTSPGIIQRAFTPILEHPTATFDHTLSGTRVRGFLGDIDGQQVAAFVYKEGPYQGQLASSFIPSANQLKMWGVP